VAFGAHVAGTLVVRRLHDRNSLTETQTVAFEPHHLARIVRDGPDRLEAEVEQDLRADAVITQIRLEAELLVGFDGVSAGVLELVGLQLVEQSDAPTLLIEVRDHAASL